MANILLILFFISSPVFAAETIRIQPQRTAVDGSYLYYTDLLRKVLGNTRQEYGEAELVSVNRLTQARAFQALNDNQIDVFWAGTNREREVFVQPIRIPLHAGLLGIRIPVIRKTDQARFDALHDLGQLQTLSACQGDHWPDSDILEANGFNVQRATKFEVMYQMLQAGRCDYFPRGINEVYAEISHVSRHDLMVYERIVLNYPFPMYFFVSRDNPRLAERLRIGMEQMASSGDLLRFLQQHPTTRDIFPLSRLSNSWIIPLHNPLLPELTPLTDKHLWIELPSQ